MTLNPSKLLCATAAALLAACGGGGGGGSSTGTMSVSLTDAPACGYESVNVTVTAVRINPNGDAGINDAGYTELTLNPARRINLLDLQNGIVTPLGSIELTAGQYRQARLVLADNDPATAVIENSVVPVGGAETALTTPSGQQSGLKVKFDLNVAGSQVTDLLIDFDACKSVVERGNSGQYNLKPVLTAIAKLETGVSGTVDPASLGPSTSISLQSGGQTIRATAPTDTGSFTLKPVPAGVYDLVIASEGKTTMVVTGVQVGDSGLTNLNAAVDNTIAVQDTAGVDTASVSGTVTIPFTGAELTVRAVQSLTGGKIIEVASLPFFTAESGNSSSGPYSLVLSTERPLVAPYTATGALTFTPDGSAGAYRLEAAATQTEGTLTAAASADVALSAGDAQTVDLTAQ